MIDIEKRRQLGFIVIGIDPGPEKSAYVVWDGKEIISKDIISNDEILHIIVSKFYAPPGTLYAVEGVQSFGKVVGGDIFKTCIMIGRILEAAKISIRTEADYLVYRPAIKGWLCGTVRAKDKDIRQALIDMLGKEVTKGVSSHIWSALAVAVYYYQSFTSAANLKKREIS
jgi:hypothetical protein